MRALRWALGLGRSGRGRLALAAALGIGAAGSAVGLAATSAWLIARASERPPVLYLMVGIVAVRAFGIGRGGLRYLERLVGHDAAFRALGDLRVATITRLERLLPSSSAGLSSGELLARFVGDVDHLVDLWVRVLLPATVAAAVGTGAAILVIVLLPSAGLVFLATMIVAAAVAPVVANRVARGASQRLAPLRGAYQAGLVDVLGALEELTVYGALDARLAHLGGLDARHRRAAGRAAFAAGVGSALTALCAGAAVWASLALGAGAVHTGALPGVLLAVVVLTPLAAHELVASAAAAAHTLPGIAASAGRVLDVLEQPDPVREPPHPRALPAGPYGLRIRQLTCSWRPDRAPVLDRLDLDVPAGSTVAIVGPSGAGKSTLAAVLLRFLDPTSGTVELVAPTGSVDLSDLDGDDVRTVVGWCAQDAHLFDSSIAANVRLARPDATDRDVERALDRAGLGEWVAGLPTGGETLVGEHGGRLSGGQRQRVALARILLADRPVVVFDEPTEHLPDDLATDLLADMVGAAAGRTTIIITHRPELLPPVDATYGLVAGRLERLP